MTTKTTLLGAGIACSKIFPWKDSGETAVSIYNMPIIVLKAFDYISDEELLPFKNSLMVEDKLFVSGTIYYLLQREEQNQLVNLSGASVGGCYALPHGGYPSKTIRDFSKINFPNHPKWSNSPRITNDFDTLVAHTQEFHNAEKVNLLPGMSTSISGNTVLNRADFMFPLTHLPNSDIREFYIQGFVGNVEFENESQRNTFRDNSKCSIAIRYQIWGNSSN